MKADTPNLNIEYQETGDCEDHDTVKAVLELCKRVDIDTHGSAMIPSIRIKEYDDGDQGVVVEIEAPPQNESWSKGVYKFIGQLWEEFPQATLYPETKEIDNCECYQYRLNICTHACDPD